MDELGREYDDAVRGLVSEMMKEEREKDMRGIGEGGGFGVIW